jgi:hypothetical protein
VATWSCFCNWIELALCRKQQAHLSFAYCVTAATGLYICVLQCRMTAWYFWFAETFACTQDTSATTAVHLYVWSLYVWSSLPYVTLTLHEHNSCCPNGRAAAWCIQGCWHCYYYWDDTTTVLSGGIDVLKPNCKHITSSLLHREMYTQIKDYQCTVIVLSSFICSCYASSYYINSQSNTSVRH